MRAVFLGTLTALALVVPAAAETVTRTHALSLIGEPQYEEGFDHLSFANPDAPKGGTLRLGAFGGFDSLNPYIPKGNRSAAVALSVESLMDSHLDELSAEYGLIAETVEYPDDFSWVVFNLRPEARFHDGSSIMAEDVAFSFEILRDKGTPFFRYYYRNVTGIEVEGPKRIRFSFSESGNRELPQIMGQLPVFSKAYWQDRDFGATTLEAPLGSGPYRVVEVEPNRRVVLERVEDYWGAELGQNRGRYNYDRVQFEYFADRTAILEAFKGYVYDYRSENSSKDWATAYDFPAVKKGDVIKALVPHSRPTGMQGFIYNLRRPVFQNAALRQALAYAFDFEWANENLFFGQYNRTESFFSNSELASSGLPSDAELALLEPLRGSIPDAVFTTPYEPPSTRDSSIRKNLGEGFKLLKDAGYRFENKKLIDPETGQTVSFEILLADPQFERIVLPFTQNLQRMGVDVSLRTVDTAQYENRVRAFDYDMVVGSYPQSESPGNEQRDFFGMEAADREGSRNLAGLKSEAVDKLIEAIVFAKDREALVTATRAMDRVLLHSHIVIPHWHISASRIAYWDKFGRPEGNPKYGVDYFSWWVAPEKAQRLNEAYR
ncbi:extracellular solute-binding protein [Minwuia sp.]|uniref:extracellular solute-binding protein n=1 Tax=Minwuia sp. TaxID=2493630 RepID=UPI003A8E3D09